MFNPQLDNLEWYKIEKRVSKNKWKQTNMIDLKKGDRFRAFNKKNEQITHEDGRVVFTALSDGYVRMLGIPEIDV